MSSNAQWKSCVALQCRDLYVYPIKSNRFIFQHKATLKEKRRQKAVKADKECSPIALDIPSKWAVLQSPTFAVSYSVHFCLQSLSLFETTVHAKTNYAKMEAASQMFMV